MAPVCRNIESYPQPNTHGNQVQYFHPYPPMWGSIPPPQMKIEQSEPHPSYNACSYDSNYGYPNPWECHSCCHHGHPPGYCSFRPPYSHFPQPPLVCYHGPYPPYPESFAPYHVPHSQYTVEQPRYEYDKNTSSENLCSRCLNKFNQRDSSGVRIEEHEPEMEKKENESFGPMRFDKNHPYPIVWIPSDYMKNTDSNKLPEPENSGPNLGNGRLPVNMKNNKENGEPSKAWNGWFPLDLNNIKFLMQDDDGKSGNQDKRGDKKEQFPFPIFWIPASGKQEDAEVGANSPKTSEEQLTMSKLIPAKQLENHESGDKQEGEISMSSSSKANVVKDIPVRENEQNDIKEEKQPVEVKKKESSDKNVKRKSSSPSKGSKLPPICLRVDPVLKRKNGNGSSRSPSPPGRKVKVHEEFNGTSKTSSAHDGKKEPCQDSKTQEHFQVKPEENYAKKEIGVTEVENAKMNCLADTTNQAQGKAGAPQEGTGKAATGKAETPTMVIDEDKRTKTVTEEKPGQEKKEKKCLSETDAAVTIQSAYRGYEVRRWEPLKKLKQIAKVSEQVNEVRRRIEVLESSVEDEKQRLAIGETIMNLLLQLDTIQGLHPSLRDGRKSVARELVSLQEKLDSLTSRKQVSESCEAGAQDRDEVVHTIELEIKDSSEESKEAEHAVNHFACPGNIQSLADEAHDGRLMEPEQQLGTSSSILDDECMANKVEQLQFVNASKEAPIGNGEVMEPEVDDAPSANLKDEELKTSVEMQNKNEEVQVRPKEPADYSSMMEQKPESETKDVIRISDEVKVCQLEGETDSVAENAKNENLELSCEEPEAKHIASALPEDRQEKAANMKLSKCQACEEIEKENDELHEVAEPVLVELPIAVVGERPSENCIEKIIQLNVGKEENSVENLELQEEKDAHSALRAQFDEPNSGETQMQHLTEGENNEELAVVFKEEKLEKGGLVEEPLEAHGTTYTHSNDICSFSTECACSAVESQVDMAITSDKNEEYKTIAQAENKTSDISVPTSGETRDSTCQLLPLEIVEDSSVKVPHIEEEDRKVFDSDANEESMTMKQELVMEDLAPSNVGSLDDAANFKDVSPNEHQLTNAEEKKLVEENEKLKEMLEKLMEAGKRQLTAISELHGRVRDLERKMSRKKKMRIRHDRRDIAATNVSNREAVSCAR